MRGAIPAPPTVAFGRADPAFPRPGSRTCGHGRDQARSPQPLLNSPMIHRLRIFSLLCRSDNALPIGNFPAACPVIIY